MDVKEAEALFADDKPVTLQEPVVESAAPVVVPAAVEGVTATPPVVEQKPAEQHIPIQAILDERDKRQALQRDKERSDQELAALRTKLAEYEAKPAAPPPDIYADPEARLAYERQLANDARVNAKLETSRFLANDKYGEETVNAAFEYFNKHPELSTQFLDKPSPFHAAVEFHKRQLAAEEVGSDPAAYKARILAEASAAMEAEIRAKVLAEVATSAPQPKLPGSLASAPAAGRSNANPAASDMERAIH